MTNDHTSLKKLPDEPGVYFFVGIRREVLYVGKATSLRDRVRSYFGSDLARTRGVHMVHMIAEARRVDFRQTDSVLEALMLEAKLIKELKPRYNTRDKDDKSFNYLVITTHEAFPRLLTIRGKDLTTRLKELGGYSKIPIYGPFPHAGQFKEALKLIRKIFPYYDCVHPVQVLREKNDRKLRFNEAIGLYPAAATTKREYKHAIRHIRLFFDGKKKQVIRSLERDMQRLAKDQEFEKAVIIKRQLFGLRHINDMSLIMREPRHMSQEGKEVRIEGYDVAHLGGSDMVGVLTVIEGGEPKKKEYRTFNIRSVTKSNDVAALTELLLRRLAHPEWQYPCLIVVDGGKAQLTASRRVLHEAGVAIPVVAVTKDEHHRPKEIQGPIKVRKEHAEDILLTNAEAHRFALRTYRKKARKRIR